MSAARRTSTDDTSPPDPPATPPAETPSSEALIYTICPSCGSVVADDAAHAAFHISLQATEGAD